MLPFKKKTNLKVNLKKTGYLLSLFLFLSNCATVISGTKSTIIFNSIPDGAEVKIDGFSIGYAPVAHRLKKSSYSIITFEKKGYKKKKY